MGDIQLYDLNDLREFVKEGKQDARLAFRNEVFLDHKRDGQFLCFEKSMGFNIMPVEGLNSVLDVSFGAATQIAAWYVGLFKNNYTPLTGSVASTALGAGGLFGECQDADYDSPATNRPAFTIVAASGGVITNAASKAAFTMAASITVYGAFLASSQAKTATTGKLGAAKKFDTARAVVDNDILYVTYQLTATSS